MVTGAAGRLADLGGKQVAGILRNASRAREFHGSRTSLAGKSFGWRRTSCPDTVSIGEDGFRMTYTITPGGSSSSAEGGMAVFTPYASEALKIARDMLERMEHVVVTDENGRPCDLADLALAAETEGTTDRSLSRTSKRTAPSPRAARGFLTYRSSCSSGRALSPSPDRLHIPSFRQGCSAWRGCSDRWRASPSRTSSL